MRTRGRRSCPSSGLEPGPELQELEQVDPDPRRVAARAADARPPASTALERCSSRRRSALRFSPRRLAALALREGDASGSTAAGRPGSVVGIDAESGEIVRQHSSRAHAVRTRGRRRRPLARGRGRADGPSHRSVVASRRDARYGRNADGHRIRRRLGLGRERPALAGHAVHRAGGDGGGAASTRRRAPNGSRSAFREREARPRTSSTTILRSRRSAVWAVAPDFSVVRADATTGAVTETIRDVPAAAVASGGAGVWVLGVDGAVVRLDERSGRVVRRASIPPGSVGSIAVGRNAAWITSPADGTLWRIGAGRAESVGATELSPGVNDVAVTSTGIWVVNPIAGTLTQCGSGDDAGHPHDRSRRNTSLGCDRRPDRLGDGDPRSRRRPHVRGDGRGDLRTERVRTAAGGRERPGGLPHHIGPAAAGRRSRECDADGRRDRVRASRATLPRRRVPRRLPVLRRLDREHGPVRRGEVRVERARVR